MESQPQNVVFRNNPEKFHPCLHIDHLDYYTVSALILQGCGRRKKFSANSSCRLVSDF